MLTITPYKKEELGEKQALFLSSNFMQTIPWAELKQEYGFKPIFCIINVDGEEEGLVVLIRPIFRGLSLAYIPHGPSVSICEKVSLKNISLELKKFMPKGTLFIRYDLLIDRSESNMGLVKGLKKSPLSVQVPDTTILNLDASEDILLLGMHKKTRYNIKLASKKGVEIKEVPITELDRWYDMYEITAIRDSISIHSKEYYRSVYEKTNMRMLIAEHEGDLLAGIFVLIQNDIATYVYGASSNIKRNLMPAYLLQWEAIKLSKSLGAKYYDFFGIPPTDDKSHPMHGLYSFKIRFGGEIIHRLGCYDYNLSPLASIFGLLERARNYYFKKIKKA